jgi:hypothetical protein
MSGSGKIEELRKKVFEDQTFRELLRWDPKKALADPAIQIEATPQNLALIKNVIDVIDNLYRGFEEHDRFVT